MTTQTPIDVRDIAIVHRTLRTTFNESAQLVQAETDPTPERAPDEAEMVREVANQHAAVGSSIGEIGEHARASPAGS